MTKPDPLEADCVPLLMDTGGFHSLATENSAEENMGLQMSGQHAAFIRSWDLLTRSKLPSPHLRRRIMNGLLPSKDETGEDEHKAWHGVLTHDVSLTTLFHISPHQLGENMASFLKGLANDFKALNITVCCVLNTKLLFLQGPCGSRAVTSGWPFNGAIFLKH